MCYHFAITWACECTTADRKALVDMLRAIGADRYIFQHERVIADHFQGYFHMRKFTNKDALPGKVRGILKPISTLHVSASSADGVQALKAYALKEETRVAGPWTDRTESMSGFDDVPLVGWQADLAEHLQSTADDRTVEWVYDKVGATGKSKFAEYMERHHGAVILTWGKIDDMAWAAAQEAPSKIYIMDLPRTKPDNLPIADIYTVCENLKNHILKTNKWKGDRVRLPWNAHVVVLANFAPDRNRWSHDRVNLTELDEVDRKEIPKRTYNRWQKKRKNPETF